MAGQKPDARQAAQKHIAQNRRARHEYEVLGTFEAGLVLQGTEVKSLRAGLVSIAEAFGHIRNGELWLQQCHIGEYSHGNRYNHVPLRERKLLVHKREIRRLWQKVTTEGQTLVPLRLYFKQGKAKVEMALARGKKKHDKRGDIRQREDKLAMDRARRDRDRGE